MKRTTNYEVRTTNKSRLLNWGLVVVYAALIFFFSSRPTLPPGLGFEFFPWQDKVAHLAEYALLCWLLIRAFHFSEKFSVVNAVSAAVILSVFYAMSDEIHQAFVPPRQCDYFDFLADSIGVAISAIYIILKSIKTATPID